MRRGFVSLSISLLALFSVSTVAWPQYPGVVRPLDHWNRGLESSSIVRADGSYISVQPAATEPAAAGAISFRHYAHKPNKAALDNYSKALKAARGNRDGEALDRLSDAVRVDPEFFEAHLEAGLLWIQAEAPDRALPHLERALAIDSSSQAAQALSAWALLKLGRQSEAELALRRSMQLGRTLPIFDQLLQYTRQTRNYSATPSQTIP